MDMEATLLQDMTIKMKVKTDQECSLDLDKTKSQEVTENEYNNAILKDLAWRVQNLDHQHAHHHRHQIILMDVNYFLMFV
jgi:hypothetical protein